MVSVSLRQKPASATEQNAPALASTARNTATSVRPVSGTPLWARNDHAPGARRPASPWDEWFIPPKPSEITGPGEHAEPTEPAEPRKPSPYPTKPAAHTASGRHAAPVDPDRYGQHAERSRTVAVASASASDAFAEPSPPFRPWRIDFARPELIEYPAVPEPSLNESPDSANVAKRLLLLLGLAYLFIAALTSGLAYTGYLTVPENNRNITRRTGNGDSADSAVPTEGTLPPKPPAPRPPSRHPNAPGLHTRPDGSRYLIMPLPADLADRFRNRTGTDRPERTDRADRTAVPAAMAMGGAL